MRILLLSALVALASSSSSTNNCNYVKLGGTILPTGVCYSTGIFGSAKLVCDPTKPNEGKLFTSGRSDCPQQTVSTPVKFGVYCGGSDCYSTFAAYGSNDCSGTSFQAGFYTGGEHCQGSLTQGRKYYCDARGFYIYLYAPTCIGISAARIVIHDTGCQAVDLSGYGIPNYIKSFRFGNCQSVNAPPGNFPLQINYHTQPRCASGTEAAAFEFGDTIFGVCLVKYEYFCAADGFYKYEYGNTTSCSGPVQEVSHVPNKCLVDFSELLISSISLNVGSVSFKCLAGGPAPKPIAFGATVEASNLKMYADSQCSAAQEIGQVYATTGACRPMTELQTSNVFPLVDGATAAAPTGWYKLSCTTTGFVIMAGYTDSQCANGGRTYPETQLGQCLAVTGQNGASVFYLSVLQCQTNLQVATPQAVGTSGGFVPGVLFLWGVVFGGLVFAA